MKPQHVESAHGGSIALYDVSPVEVPLDHLPLLFAHAAGFNAGVWGPVVRRLRHRGHRHAFDLPGHGLSRLAPEQPLDWYTMGSDVLKAAEAIAHLGQPIGVGHSMGAAFMVIAEVVRPGTFRALWIYEPVIPTDPTVPPEIGAQPPRKRDRRDRFESIDDAYDSYRSKPGFARVADESLRAFVESSFAVENDGSAVLRCAPADESAASVAWNEHRVFDRLGEIACPVHVVRGNLASYQARWAAELPRVLRFGSHEVFDQLHHLGPLEQPSVIAESIDRFLEPFRPVDASS